VFRLVNFEQTSRERKLGVKNRKQLPISHSRSAQMSPALLPSQDDLPICFFYQTTLEFLINADRALYLHRQLPTLLSRSDTKSALHLATQAISLAVWARSRPGDLRARHLARKRYWQALVAMNAAIRDKVEVKSDETLYAVLLLSGYEVCLLQLLSGSPSF